MSNEFMPVEKEGQCIYCGLDTFFKHRGEYTSLHFLIAGRKLWERFNYVEPELTLEKAIDTIISAQSYRVIYGEDAMDAKGIRRAESWKHKVQKMFSR